jgi:farnesyl-diphosphate farnesyltransferase
MRQPTRPTPDLPALLRGVSRSFYLSIRLLPAALRQPVGVAYLLARAADTLADTTNLPPSGRAVKLIEWTAAIEGSVSATDVEQLADSAAPLQRDNAERALITLLPECLAALQALEAPDRADVRAVLRKITRGQLLDLARFPDTSAPRALDNAAQLNDYTYLVAGCVGEFWTDLCVRHMPGFATLPHGEMRALGRRYGMALQLVNILRDAGADLAEGRCYFPADELAAAGLSAAEITREPDRFEHIWRHWEAQAREGLALGMRYSQAVHSRRVRAASALPALLAARTLAMLRAAGPQRLGRKVKVPRSEVRGMLGRMAFTLAGRSGLQAMYGRLEWDNPPP